MTQDLAVTDREQHGIAVSWTNEQVELIKRTIAVGATNDELQLFLHQAKRTGLDPLSRQIHFVKRKDKGTIQTAIDGYRLIADRTGKYAGSDDYVFDEGLPQYTHMASRRGNPTTATVTVYKMCDGIRTPFTATAAWGEYFPGEAQGFMWKKMPYLMIGKCAEALALRKAFPAELSGIYTNEEMMQAQPSEVVHASTVEEQADEMRVPNYGPDAGKPFSQVSIEHLKDYLAGAERSIKDPKKANFLQKNEAMREALKTEIEQREGVASGSSRPDPSTSAGEKATVHQPSPADTLTPVKDLTISGWGTLMGGMENDPDLADLLTMVKEQCGLKSLAYPKVSPKDRVEFLTELKTMAAANGLGPRVTALGL